MRMRANDTNTKPANINIGLDGGFTLVELVVAVAVFAAMAAAVSSIFVSAVASQRKNINQEEVLDNGRFVLEAIGRAVRQSAVVTGDGSGSSLTINHPTKGALTYLLDNSAVKESAAGSSVALTSAGVVAERFNFLVQGNGLADKTQPRVVVSISLRSVESSPGLLSSVNLQTTVTPRNLQIQ